MEERNSRPTDNPASFIMYVNHSKQHDHRKIIAFQTTINEILKINFSCQENAKQCSMDFILREYKVKA